ncbi:MAG: TRAP transporter small permease subunit [Rhodobacteraceae bacterium]|nr:TRAP transporter small permease subunit [Paracoccaceae bacterium]
MANHAPRPHTTPKSSNVFVTVVQSISSVAGWSAAAMIFAAVFLTCQMIFVRFVLNGSTVWQTEAVVFLVIAATLIGLPFVQQQGGHVNVDLIPLALRGRARFALAILTLSLSAAITAVMAFYGYEHWHLAYTKGWTTDTVTAVPLWIPYLSLPIGFGLLLLQLASDLVALLTKSKPPFGLEVS